MIEQEVKKLNNKLAKLIKQAKPCTVAVGYTQNYAMKVHEDLNARHAKGTQAKYLEQPLRENMSVYADAITKAYKESNDIELSLLKGGVLILADSQKLVPVDTGALRASGYVKKESQ